MYFTPPSLQSVSRPAGLTAVGRLVRSRVPEAVFVESVGQEITFVLPYSGARDGTFARLFQDLDLAMCDLGLTSYGISDTTLEEVLRAPADGERLREPQGTFRSPPSFLWGHRGSEILGKNFTFRVYAEPFNRKFKNWRPPSAEVENSVLLKKSVKVH